MNLSVHPASILDFFRFRCTVYIVLILLPLQISAQSHYELISNYSKETYLGGTQNWDIHLDKNGVVYFGNNKGVLSYNGSSWNLHALPNRTIVRSIAERAEGGFYVGGQNQFGFFEKTPISSGNYTSLTKLVPDAFYDFEDVWAIFETGEGVFFCTEKAIFLIHDGKCRVIEPFGSRFENFFMYKGMLMAQELGSGLFVYKNGNLTPFMNDARIADIRIAALIEDFQGRDLMILRTGDFYFFDGNILKTYNCDASDFTKVHKAYTAKRLSNGNILIGTTQNGAFMADTLGNICSHWNKDLGISNNTVLSVFEDARGNAWLGLDNGLTYIELNSPFTKIDRFNGVEGTGYAALSKDGNVYLGTNQGLYVNSDPAKPFRLIDRTKGQVWSIHDMGEGFVLNTHDGAFYQTNGQFTPISDVKGSWKVLELKTQSKWLIQGAYSGFYLYEKTGDPEKPLKFRGKMEGFTESARIFEEDENGYIWISHAYLGLYRLKPDYRNLRFTEVKRYDSKDGLPEDLYITVSSIRNEMVFSTTRGVYKYDSQSDRLIEHETFTDLLGAEVNMLRIFEDSRGNVWFVTDREFGLIQIMSTGLFNEVDVVYFNRIQDRLVDGFEDVFAFGNNKVYIPLEDGFYRFDTEAPLPKEFSHPLAIEKVYITTGRDSLIYQGVENSSEPLAIELNTNFKDLRFHYVLPAYGKLNQISYEYTLEGFDDEWSQPVTALSKEYSNLNPGAYIFKVRATNSFGQLSPESAFSFTILPPWYATNTAKTLFALGFVLLLGGLIRYVSNREYRKTEEVKKKSVETLKRKEQEFQREKEKSENEIIRLRNEKLRAEVSHKNAELASTTMHLVQKSEILQKVKTDLEEVAKESSDKVRERIRRISRAIAEDVRLDKNWERFEAHFDQVHENFFKNLRSKYPELTPKDQKLCAYLRMNLATKEIAPLLNISVRGVEISRYRLRKKLGIDSDTNLVSFVMEI